MVLVRGIFKQRAGRRGRLDKKMITTTKSGQIVRPILWILFSRFIHQCSAAAEISHRRRTKAHVSVNTVNAVFKKKRRQKEKVNT